MVARSVLASLIAAVINNALVRSRGGMLFEFEERRSKVEPPAPPPLSEQTTNSVNDTTQNLGAMTRGVSRGLRWILLVCVALFSLPTDAFQSKSNRAVNLPQKTV